jgi:hypothetical protein
MNAIPRAIIHLQGQRDAGNLRDVLGGPLRAGRVGQLDAKDEIALVLLGNETGRHGLKARHTHADNREVSGEYQKGHAQPPADDLDITAPGRGERAVEQAAEVGDRRQNKTQPAPQAGPRRDPLARTAQQ